MGPKLGGDLQHAVTPKESGQFGLDRAVTQRHGWADSLSR